MKSWISGLLTTSAVMWAPEGVAAPAADPVVAPPAPAPVKPTEGEGFLGGKDPADPGPGPAAFPDNWRDLLAGDDKDAKKLLERYKAPSDLGKAFREQRETISKGVQAPARPADDDAEGLKTWREKMGIPAEPTAYQLTEPVAKRFGDDDKPNMEVFITGMHKRDMSPAAVNAALDVYADMQEQTMGALVAADNKAAGDTADELRQEWGAEFRQNKALAEMAAEKLTPGINWFRARLPDGRMLSNIPEVVRTFARLGKEEFTDVHFAGETNTKVTENRMSEIKNMMADTKSPYYTDQKIRDEYAVLVNAEAAVKRKRDKEQ